MTKHEEQDLREEVAELRRRISVLTVAVFDLASNKLASPILWDLGLSEGIQNWPYISQEQAESALDLAE